jgi:hypothetical protein
LLNIPLPSSNKTVQTLLTNSVIEVSRLSSVKARAVIAPLENINYDVKTPSDQTNTFDELTPRKERAIMEAVGKPI